MIKAYVVGIPAYQENEEIEIRFRVYKEDELISERKVFQGYKKPLLVSHFAVLALLKGLKKLPREETEIYIYDAALNEQLRGTSTTRNTEVRKLAAKIKEELSLLDYPVKIIDLSTNHKELLIWNEILDF